MRYIKIVQIRVILFAVVGAIYFAMQAFAGTPAPFYTSLAEAQKVSDGKLPILIDFYTDW